MGENVEQVARILGRINDAANTIRELQSKNAALETEAAALREAVRVLGAAVAAVRSDTDWPQLTSSMQKGLWCGLEDRDLTDRYECATHGYERALERCSEFIANATAEVDTNPFAFAAVKGG